MVAIEMPVVAPDRGSESASPAERLVELTATLERTAADIASTIRGPEALHHLSTAIRHLEVVCDHLAETSSAIAFSTTDMPGGSRFDKPHPAARAAAWRLHHLSSAFGAARDASAVVAAVADDFERYLAGDD